MNKILLRRISFLLIAIIGLMAVSCSSEDSGRDENIGEVKMVKVWNADDVKVSLKGYVVNAGSNVTIVFEYGQTPTSFDKKVYATTVLKGDTTFVSTTLGNLVKDTKYYVRLSAIKLDGEHVSEVKEFQTTSGATPTISSVEKIKVGLDNISILAKVNPAGKGICRILIGKTPDDLQPVNEEDGGVSSEITSTSSSPVDFNIEVRNLDKGTDYYLMLVAENEKGQRESSIMLIRTNYEIVSDLDGVEYYATKIGNQVWTTSNWACDKYADGSMIDSCFIYQDKASNLSSFGRLYTYDVLKAKNIAPEGWRVPTEADWFKLINEIGGEFSAGNQLKNGNFLGPDTSIDYVDRYNFSIQSTGMRNAEGTYFHAANKTPSSYAYFWGMTEKNKGEAFRIHCSYMYGGCYFGTSTTKNAYSVRLVKDI